MHIFYVYMDDKRFADCNETHVPVILLSFWWKQYRQKNWNNRHDSCKNHIWRKKCTPIYYYVYINFLFRLFYAYKRFNRIYHYFYILPHSMLICVYSIYKKKYMFHNFRIVMALAVIAIHQYKMIRRIFKSKRPHKMVHIHRYNFGDHWRHATRMTSKLV